MTTLFHKEQEKFEYQVSRISSVENLSQRLSKENEIVITALEAPNSNVNKLHRNKPNQTGKINSSCGASSESLNTTLEATKSLSKNISQCQNILRHIESGECIWNSVEKTHIKSNI